MTATTFTIKFSTSGSTFQFAPKLEMHEIVTDVLSKAEPGGTGIVRDGNGNQIGKWSWR